MTHDSASLRIAAATFSEDEEDEEDIAIGLAFLRLDAVHVGRSVAKPMFLPLGSPLSQKLLHPADTRDSLSEPNQVDVFPQGLSVLCFHGDLGSCGGGASRWRHFLVACPVPELALLVVSLSMDILVSSTGPTITVLVTDSD